MHHPTDRITHTTAFVTPVVPLLGMDLDLTDSVTTVTQDCYIHFRNIFQAVSRSASPTSSQINSGT